MSASDFDTDTEVPLRGKKDSGLGPVPHPSGLFRWGIQGSESGQGVANQIQPSSLDSECAGVLFKWINVAKGWQVITDSFLACS